jgi:hypothetical protein
MKERGPSETPPSLLETREDLSYARRILRKIKSRFNVEGTCSCDHCEDVRLMVDILEKSIKLLRERDGG